MIKYGLISETDARTLEKTIDLIQDEKINLLEVGVYGGDTGRGLKEYCESKGKECFITGIDNNKDGEKLRFEYDKLIIGNSTEVYHKLEDKSQHIIIVDGDHSLIGVISDYFAYKSKIIKGGYFCFHDSGEHIGLFKDFQHGDTDNADAYISVKPALYEIGLLGDRNMAKDIFGFELIFDEADYTDRTGGFCVFKKLY